MALSIKTGVSTQTDLSGAVKEITSQIKQDGIRLILFFASSVYNGQALTQELAAAFPGVKLAGCSTAGEITPKGFMHKSITAMSED